MTDPQGLSARIRVRAVVHPNPSERGKMKKCAKCEQVKPAENFYVDRFKKSGLSSYCKICNRTKRNLTYVKNKINDKQYFKEYYKKYPLKAKEYALKKYGLTIGQFNELKKSQNYLCKICGENETNLKLKLFVDHCHATGKVRGLLCQSCNTMIGNAKDSVLVLQSAITYLLSSI